MCDAAANGRINASRVTALVQAASLAAILSRLFIIEDLPSHYGSSEFRTNRVRDNDDSRSLQVHDKETLATCCRVQAHKVA
jgi:hypothetical protein